MNKFLSYIYPIISGILVVTLWRLEILPGWCVYLSSVVILFLMLWVSDNYDNHKGVLFISNAIYSILLIGSIAIYVFSIDARCWVCSWLPVERCAERYWAMMYNQVKSDNLDNVISITYSIGEWGDNKGEEERERFEDAMQQWVEENPYKAERIEDYFRKHRDEIPKQVMYSTGVIALSKIILNDVAKNSCIYLLHSLTLWWDLHN